MKSSIKHRSRFECLLGAWLLPGFRRFYSLNWRFYRRHTPAGRGLLLAMLATAILGVDTDQALVYQLFSLLAALWALAWVMLPFGRVQVGVRRILPPFVCAGESFSYVIQVDNPGPGWQKDLRLLEDLEDPRPSYVEFMAAREPGEALRNGFDRRVGYHRFVWLMRSRERLRCQETLLDPVPPGGRIRAVMNATARQRGPAHFVGVTVARPDPLGLIRALVRIPRPQTLLVLPKTYPLPARLQLPGVRQHQVGGESMAYSVGDAAEFVSLRDYREGDSPRHIHWPSWAKTGKPVIREFREEYFTRHALILDTFCPFGGEVFEEAVSLAASFAAVTDDGEALLDLLFVSNQAHCFTMGRGVSQSRQIQEILAAVFPLPDQPFAQLTALVMHHVAAVSGVLVILLAWDGPRQELVRGLTQLGIPVRVMLVVPEEASGSPVDLEPLGEHPEGLIQLVAGRVAAGLASL
ncbi:MAG: DUF58 domain-containing protein [Magnetococcus sp. YQC-5]